MNSPLARETAAAKALKAKYPEVSDDDDAVRDLIEGQTDLHELLGYVLRSIADDEALASATGERIKALQARKKRFDTRATAKRLLCETAMSEALLKRYEGAECTATLSARKPKLHVSDAEDLPDEFVRIERKPDTAAIRAALEKGDTVPGATLSNAPPSLSIRTK